jgi:8-oxo-dGTP pyrophosphatase MutT (NUDIX family)
VARGSSPEPVAPKPAATVVLARDLAHGDGIEVFLVQRHGAMGFMGGVHVFPGGTLSADDFGERVQARIAEPAEQQVVRPWRPELGREHAIGLAVTAIRETFEEAGILLGGIPPATDLAALRARLLAGEAFAALLEESGLNLRLDVLRPLSRWVTPKLEPKRYDTLFYLARCPDDQRAEHDRQETVAGVWLTPAAALDRRRGGEIRLAPPTARTLDGLRGVRSVEAALAGAAAAAPPRIEPVVHIDGDEVWVLLPGDPDHPDRERALEGATRELLRRAERTKSG